ncbi:uncharacterized protein LOC128243378 [Mya arenaria]|uniref:uncharacterized protein LOC128243378 n=1 Tax=Mya arenaria TaxID=6604 RepID=UPI0022E3E67C|nr:uncharacterized protein LOC128243378 [Mya arenaria]
MEGQTPALANASYIGNPAQRSDETCPKLTVENCNGHVHDRPVSEAVATEDARTLTPNASGTDLEGDDDINCDEFGCLNGNLSDEAELNNYSVQHAIKRKHKHFCKNGTKHSNSLGEAGKKLNGTPNVNGLNVNHSGHSRNVCNTYRHENDLIFGRTRGGTHHENDLVVVSSSTSEHSIGISGVEAERQSSARNGTNDLTGLNNGDIVQNNAPRVSLCEDNAFSGNSNISDGTVNDEGLHAPLAEPESLSDDDADVGRGILSRLRKANNDVVCYSCVNGMGNNSDTQKPCDSNGDAFSSDEEHSSDNVKDEREGSLHLNHTNQCHEDILAEGNDLESNPDGIENLNIRNNPVSDQSEIDEGNESEHSVFSEISDMNDENSVENNVEENVEEGLQENVIVEEQTEDDNDNNDDIDDIGDFIEADLPPNVERLAFFSRDSTSDEDEGCGDEVVVANDEDIVSDNETIDPTDRSEHYMGRASGLNVTCDEKDACAGSHGHLSNFLSSREGDSRGELGEAYACNISCDKSTEENDVDFDDDFFMDSVDSQDNRAIECSSCSVQGHSRNSSYGDRNSAGLKGDHLCACCDRPMEVDSERQKEMGVDVCDKCFREHNIEQKRWTENLYGNRRRSHPSSASNFLLRNGGNLLAPLNNNSDKVSNNSSSCYARFSSSDSDPYDRVFVSDSSDVQSPDADSRLDPVFQPSNIPTSDGNVQYRNSGSENQSDGQRLNRMSVSLDFTSPEDVSQCPYYTRRSRSLDQEFGLGDNASDNRSGESEVPNIAGAVASSNFQEDESNTREKVFVKEAYSVTPPQNHRGRPLSPTIRGCSSSDEEENERMPIAVSDNSECRAGQVCRVSDRVSNMNLMSEDSYHEYCGTDKQSRQHKMRYEESEPIYEDIDQLGLLLEESCTDQEPGEGLATQPICHAISKLRRKRRARSPENDVEKVMIWKEYEAYLIQVKQIGTSACGPTAVLNVLKAFDFQLDKDEVVDLIRSNLRMEAAPIPYYLFSRYNAGTTADDLVEGVTKVTRGAIRGRFFHFHPYRDVNLLKWLGYWMQRGAVPVATLNLQRGVKPGWTIPDAWHHQMVYGVSNKGVYLTNPLEIVPVSVIQEQLTSDSVLLVRRQDVVGRFRDWCPLNEIIRQKDPRWRTMNVLGQVVHMLREQCLPLDQLVTMKGQLTSHVSIPAAYKAGISLFMRASSDKLQELMETPELPVKESK